MIQMKNSKIPLMRVAAERPTNSWSMFSIKPFTQELLGRPFSIDLLNEKRAGLQMPAQSSWFSKNSMKSAMPSQLS